MKTKTNHGAEIALPVKRVPEKTYIVTAYYDVFREYVRDNGLVLRNCIHANSTMRMHGLRSGKVIILPDAVIFNPEIARWRAQGLTVTHA